MRVQKERGGELRKPLVLPCVPVLIAPHRGVPPLVRRLVRDDDGDLLLAGIGGDHREHGIFHAAVGEIRLNDGIAAVGVCDERFAVVSKALRRAGERLLRVPVVQIIIGYGDLPHRRFGEAELLAEHEGNVAHVLRTDMVGGFSVLQRAVARPRVRDDVTLRHGERDVVVGALAHEGIAVGGIDVFAEAVLPMAEHGIEVGEIDGVFPRAEAVIDFGERDGERERERDALVGIERVRKLGFENVLVLSRNAETLRALHGQHRDAAVARAVVIGGGRVQR